MFLKRFICLVEVHYHKVNLNSDKGIVLSVRPPQGGCHIKGIDGISPHLCSSLFGNFRVYIASFMPRTRFFISFSTIFTLSQSMIWFSFAEWSVRAEPHTSLCDCLFLSLVYTTASLTFSASDQCSFTAYFQFSFHLPYILHLDGEGEQRLQKLSPS